MLERRKKTCAIAECNKNQNCIHLVESLLDNWLKNNHLTVDITVFCFGGKLELHSTSLPSTSVDVYTVEALVSGHPRDAKKVSVTGAGRLREWFS